MKVVLCPALILASVSAPSALGADYQLMTKCHVILSIDSVDPDEPDVVIDIASEPFAPTVEGFNDSYLAFDLGDYRLRAMMQMGGTSADPGTQPHLTTTLQKGEGAGGLMHFSSIGGLELDTRTAAAPATMSSIAFVQAEYRGQSVSRLDFACSVIKL